MPEDTYFLLDLILFFEPSGLNELSNETLIFPLAESALKSLPTKEKLIEVG